MSKKHQHIIIKIKNLINKVKIYFNKDTSNNDKIERIIRTFNNFNNYEIKF